MIVWHPNCRILLHLFPLSSAMLAYFHSHSRKKYIKIITFSRKKLFCSLYHISPKFGELGHGNNKVEIREQSALALLCTEAKHWTIQRPSNERS